VLTILVATLSIGNGLRYHCSFEMQNYDRLGSRYMCRATEIDEYGVNITEITGTHMPGRNNNDVEGFSAGSHHSPHFAGNLFTFFPNLKALDYVSCGIRSISSQQLFPYPQLRFLVMQGSQIQYLPGDLFRFTPNVEYISFPYSQIRHVGHQLLANMPNLHTVWIARNPCIDRNAFTWTDIQQLNTDLPYLCPLPGQN
jgi:hypothetical protein